MNIFNGLRKCADCLRSCYPSHSGRCKECQKRRDDGYEDSVRAERIRIKMRAETPNERTSRFIETIIEERDD